MAALSCGWYYYRVMPDDCLKSNDVIFADWNEYRHTEFVTDFVNPQNIAYSVGVLPVKQESDYAVAVTLLRSKNLPPFSKQELAILKVIQPHLANFHTIFSSLEAPRRQLPDAGDLVSGFKCLTRREAEIVVLLCRRYSTGMIQSKLVISRLTVYKHIEHIFEKLGVTSRDELVAKVFGNLQIENQP